MTRSAALVSVCVISIAVSSSPTSAAEDCFKALIQDRVKFDLHDTRALAITELIRQNTSESDNAEAKNGAFGASRSRQKAANFFSDTTGKYNSERIESLATQTLSKNAVIASLCTMHAPTLLRLQSDGLLLPVPKFLPMARSLSTVVHRSRVFLRSGVPTKPTVKSSAAKSGKISA